MDPFEKILQTLNEGERLVDDLAKAVRNRLDKIEEELGRLAEEAGVFLGSGSIESFENKPPSRER